MTHPFTKVIEDVLYRFFAEDAAMILKNSELLKYLNKKTRSVNKGSKSRSSFANIYAIYVLVEDYVKGGFHKKDDYNKYDGAIFSDLLKRKRELPFGEKMQNHALNNRLNDEFRKYFPMCEQVPIIRDLKTKRYWINEHLLIISIGNKKLNISEVVMDIIDQYIEAKTTAFNEFLSTCVQLKSFNSKSNHRIKKFIISLLKPNIDARIFEIVTFSILKHHYSNIPIYIGFTMDSIEEEKLHLFKTGRTNANDGGIDFVMKPIGRFFQVTESYDLKKYFLDIDKIQKFPITFVIKSDLSVEDIKSKIEKGAREQYLVDSIIDKYLKAVEEIINLERLVKITNELSQDKLKQTLEEIITQSKVEFNLSN
ncbi:MAG: hypothetical protein OXE77_01895 [Flavobacteriaceae bacterium]|nr:hypothetical protein [Flavobacteriaceae bacterium]MCY4268502.1 hypothetical protein [Flavobacteriaceae bacterium]